LVAGFVRRRQSLWGEASPAAACVDVLCVCIAYAATCMSGTCLYGGKHSTSLPDCLASPRSAGLEGGCGRGRRGKVG
jgi:hypothetical protein